MNSRRESRSLQEAKLDFLVGSWVSSDTTVAGPQGMGGQSHGTATYGWEVNGSWLTYDFHTELPGIGPYAVHGGIAADKDGAGYLAFAANSMGALLCYEGTWESDDSLVFCLTAPKRDPDTRVSYIKSSNGTVRMRSERPGRGEGREIYFETVLTRS